MSLMSKENEVLLLQYLGEDFWARPVYRDQFDQLWKDIGLGSGDHPSLHSAVGNEFDGEPDLPIRQSFELLSAPSTDQDISFQYQMLDRLRSDCDYYLSFGNRNPGVLYYKDEEKQISAMKAIWMHFSKEDKPVWLTWEQILDYEKQMSKNTDSQ